jgi:uracil permease
MKKVSSIGEKGIYDARELGAPRMLVLGLQHLFAMFGATVLVPILTGLSVSSTLLFAGLGTLLFHFLSKGKVPAFLGSSFAFLAGYSAIAPNGEKELLPYACLGVACAGLLYLLVSALIKIFGVKKVMRFFPPIVTGPMVIAIGLTLSSSAVNNCSENWIIALVAIVVVIGCNMWGKGMIKIIPIMLGAIASYAVALIWEIVTAGVKGYEMIQSIAPSQWIGAKIWEIVTIGVKGSDMIQSIAAAPWIGVPFTMDNTVFAIAKNPDKGLIVTAIIAIMPIAIATMMEHVGDICAIGSTTKQNYIEDPGLHRTMLGDGLATILASLFGAPANTTYGENTGVLALSKVYDPRVIRIAAVFAVILSFCPKFATIISVMPSATIGGVSLILYGMISAVGVRNLVENKVDLSKSRNVIVAALILVLAIGVNYSNAGAINIPIGSVTISLSGLAIAAIVGIVANAVLPGKDYEFKG